MGERTRMTYKPYVENENDDEEEEEELVHTGSN